MENREDACRVGGSQHARAYAGLDLGALSDQIDHYPVSWGHGREPFILRQAAECGSLDQVIVQVPGNLEAQVSKRCRETAGERCRRIRNCITRTLCPITHCPSCLQE
jgi:hypothetical protein